MLTYITLPTTRGLPSWPRSVPVENDQTGRSSATFDGRDLLERAEPLQAVITAGHVPFALGRVQGPSPRRAAWALADAATATLSPAAIPPDSTFCVKRFITDLRMKGGSTALLHSLPRAAMPECRSRRRGASDAARGPRRRPRTATGRARPRSRSPEHAASVGRMPWSAPCEEEVSRECASASERSRRGLVVGWRIPPDVDGPCRWRPRGVRPRDARSDGETTCPMVAANGNKPIIPLSDAAEPRCVSVKNCSWGGGSHLRLPPSVLHSGSSGALRFAPNPPAQTPRSEPAKSPTTGGLGGPVYSLQK